MKIDLPSHSEVARHTGGLRWLFLATALLEGCVTAPPERPSMQDSSLSMEAPAPTSELSRELRQVASSNGKQDLEALSNLIALTRDDTIFTISARTVDFNGQALVPRMTFRRATGLHDGNDRVGDPLDRDLTVLISTVQGVIGLDPDVTLSITVPYIQKSLKSTMNGQRERLNSEGFGDVPIMAKWRFFKEPELGGTTEMAVIGGVKLPTGQHHARDGGMRLPRPLQPGSGSVDGIMGLAFTRLWDGGRWLINADTIFKLNTDADGYRFGNHLRFDVGAQFRIYPDRYESYDQTTVNLLLELNGAYAWRDRLGGSALAATGGLKLFLSPGIQVILNEDLLFEAGVQIPIYRDLNGPQLAEDFRATVGLRWRF